MLHGMITLLPCPCYQAYCQVVHHNVTALGGHCRLFAAPVQLAQRLQYHRVQELMGERGGVLLGPSDALAAALAAFCCCTYSGVALAASNEVFPAVGHAQFNVNANRVRGSWQAHHLQGLSLALSLQQCLQSIKQKGSSMTGHPEQPNPFNDGQAAAGDTWTLSITDTYQLHRSYSVLTIWMAQFAKTFTN